MPDNETPAESDVETPPEVVSETPPETEPVSNDTSSKLMQDAIPAPLHYTPPSAAARPVSRKGSLNPLKFGRPPAVVIAPQDKRFSGILQPKAKRA